MSGKEKADPDFADASSWELHHHSAADNSPYFFDTDDYKESSILSEFGWDIPPESSGKCNRGGGFAVLPPIEPDLVESRAVEDSDLIGSSVEPIVEASASPSNPSISSSSSGDQPDKSSASGISSSADANPSPEPAGKTKKKAQKRIRQPRFAFVTKSEVDHLEDGYRWRKYGQKAVKNSQFPRSYYRCTNSKCMVKKRIERSSEDPTVVITTYEGQHCHHSVGYPTPNNSHLLYHPPPPNSLRPPRVRAGGGGGGGEPHTATLQTQPPDEGLLGDIVPPRMRNNG